MQRWFSMLSVLLLAGCAAATNRFAGPQATGRSGAPAPSQSDPGAAASPSQASRAAALPDLGPAPELDNRTWLNTPAPLRLRDLRGRVVLLEMWTFDCINCRHVIPSLLGWYNTYAPQGLVIIGNHFPEFEHERSLDNLKAAIQELHIPYPVAQDNDGATWDAYHNQYWPALYLIDKTGQIRYRHFGEGAYPETEAAIQALLAESAGGRP